MEDPEAKQRGEGQLWEGRSWQGRLSPAASAVLRCEIQLAKESCTNAALLLSRSALNYLPVNQGSFNKSVELDSV